MKCWTVVPTPPRQRASNKAEEKKQLQAARWGHQGGENGAEGTGRKHRETGGGGGVAGGGAVVARRQLKWRDGWRRSGKIETMVAVTG